MRFFIPMMSIAASTIMFADTISLGEISVTDYVKSNNEFISDSNISDGYKVLQKKVLRH